jgi:hypothetical protein
VPVVGCMRRWMTVRSGWPARPGRAVATLATMVAPAVLATMVVVAALATMVIVAALATMVVVAAPVVTVAVPMLRGRVVITGGAH